MPELLRFRADHAAAVLAFELANRVYFAASISDRGDEFYDRFTERHSALLAEQEASIGAFYALVAEDGSILSRFNLVFAESGTAKLGYRVTQHVASRGVATATVLELCGLAVAQYGERRIPEGADQGWVYPDQTRLPRPTSAVSEARGISATWPPIDPDQPLAAYGSGFPLSGLTLTRLPSGVVLGGDDLAGRLALESLAIRSPGRIPDDRPRRAIPLSPQMYGVLEHKGSSPS